MVGWWGLGVYFPNGTLNETFLVSFRGSGDLSKDKAVQKYLVSSLSMRTKKMLVQGENYLKLTDQVHQRLPVRTGSGDLESSLEL